MDAEPGARLPDGSAPAIFAPVHIRADEPSFVDGRFAPPLTRRTRCGGRSLRRPVFAASRGSALAALSLLDSDLAYGQTETAAPRSQPAHPPYAKSILESWELP